MTGRRSHGRLSALNGVVHQGSPSLTTRPPWCPGSWKTTLSRSRPTSPLSTGAAGPFQAVQRPIRAVRTGRARSDRSSSRPAVSNGTQTSLHSSARPRALTHLVLGTRLVLVARPHRRRRGCPVCGAPVTISSQRREAFNARSVVRSSSFVRRASSDPSSCFSSASRNCFVLGLYRKLPKALVTAVLVGEPRQSRKGTDPCPGPPQDRKRFRTLDTTVSDLPCTRHRE